METSLNEIIASILNDIPNSVSRFAKDTSIVAGLKLLQTRLNKFLTHKNYRVEDLDYELITKEVKRSTTKEEVLNEINTDIVNLRDILQKAVIPAINLELAFVNSIDKQIKLILSALRDQEKEDAKIFKRYASYIISIFKENDFNQINQSIENKKVKEEFLEQIKNFTF